MVQVAVFGYGTVGSGVVEVMRENQKEICKKAGTSVVVKYVLDIRKFPGDPVEEILTDDVNVIINDPEIRVVCETMGGIEPAYTFTKKALEKGISVCTSNKELVANHGPELIELAKKNSCNYMFEASVGGGIPIIRPLNSSLTPEKIDGIKGILNGTTNYILTRMAKDGSEFADVLKEAQEKGYAERKPEADVEGYDACRKIAILSSLVYGKTVRYEEIYTEGITKIRPDDFKYAKAMNSSIKLLAISHDVEGSCYAMVAPFLVNEDNPLYSVNDVFNAVCVHGNMLGDTMYYGRGAGKLPTASAVVSDVIDCAKHLGKFIFCFWESEKVELSPMEESSRRFFVRIPEKEAYKVAEVFEKVTYVEADGILNETAFVTEVMKEKEYREKAEHFDRIISMIRVD